MLFQNVTAILLQNATEVDYKMRKDFITKCDSFITKNDSYYKLRKYTLQKARMVIWVRYN